MKKFIESFLTILYYSIFGYITIGIWSIVIALIINSSGVIGSLNDGIIFLIVCAFYGLLYGIRIIIKTIFILNTDIFESNRILLNKSKKILDDINFKINKLKTANPIKFDDNLELKKLFTSICLNIKDVKDINLTGDKHEIEISFMEKGFPANMSNFSKDSLHYEHFHWRYPGFTIFFKDKPPLQLVKLQTEIHINPYKTFNKLYKEKIIQFIESIISTYNKLDIDKEKYKNLNYKKLFEFNYHDLQVIEYGLKFGNIVQRINKSDYDKLCELYNEAYTKYNEFKLNSHIKKYINE